MKLKEIYIPRDLISRRYSLTFYEAQEEKLEYATIVDHSRGGKPRLLYETELYDLLKQFDKNTKDTEKITYAVSGKIPPGTLFIDFRRFTNFRWISQRKKRLVQFASNGKLNGKHRIEVLSMLFMLTGTSLSVTPALIDPEKDTVHTYQSPYPNGSEGVCMGNQNFKTLVEFDSFADYFEYWEELYFEAPFTNHGIPYNSFKGTTYMKYWNKTIKDGRMTFTTLNSKYVEGL